MAQDPPQSDWNDRMEDFREGHKPEMVDHPAHYGGADNPYEAIKVIDAWDLNFCLGNTVKYISRADHKGKRLEDLKKARWYLDHAIESMEAGGLNTGG